MLLVHLCIPLTSRKSLSGCIEVNEVNGQCCQWSSLLSVMDWRLSKCVCVLDHSFWTRAVQYIYIYYILALTLQCVIETLPHAMYKQGTQSQLLQILYWLIRKENLQISCFPWLIFMESQAVYRPPYNYAHFNIKINGQLHTEITTATHKLICRVACFSQILLP